VILTARETLSFLDWRGARLPLVDAARGIRAHPDTPPKADQSAVFEWNLKFHTVNVAEFW